jgi:hypothetical protein
MSKVIDLNSAEMNTPARHSDAPDSLLMDAEDPNSGDGGTYSCSYYARTFYPGERICIETNVYRCNGYDGNWVAVGEKC